MASLYTIGHSNRDADTFLALLRRHDIKCLVDVRRFPGSRRLPQFNREALQAQLATANIDYRWMEPLGGRRSSKDVAAEVDDASAAGWENSAFRAYAAYMQTPAFDAALHELLAIAEKQRTAIMCSEAVWWQCHRRLISDALIAKGRDVLHILSESAPKPHALTEFARIDGERATYPAPLFDQQTQR
jgi:uncharacterized protein (DUF488 family)